MKELFTKDDLNFLRYKKKSKLQIKQLYFCVKANVKKIERMPKGHNPIDLKKRVKSYDD